MTLTSLRQASKAAGLRYSAVLYHYQRGRIEAPKVGTVALIDPATLGEKMRELGYTSKEEKAQREQ